MHYPFNIVMASLEDQGYHRVCNKQVMTVPSTRAGFFLLSWGVVDGGGGVEEGKLGNSGKKKDL